MNDKPNDACSASRETDKLMRSKKLTSTPKASRKAIRHRLRGTCALLEIGCGKSAPETGCARPVSQLLLFHYERGVKQKSSLDANAREQSTVHKVIASGTEPGFIGSQKRRQFRDLLGRANTAERVSGAKACEHFFRRQIWREVRRGACQHRRADRTRADRIDADVVGRMVEGQGARQAVNCAF